MTVHRYEGVFEGLTGAQRLTPSDFRVLPFYDDLDFETFEMLAQVSRERWVQTRLNYTQKYTLMSQVLAAVRECAGPALDEIILNSRMPSTIRMPTAMLGPDIFVVVDVQAEARLVPEGRSFITVREGLIRYAIEEGSNELLVDWHGAPPDGGERLRRMADSFERLGLRTVGITAVDFLD